MPDPIVWAAPRNFHVDGEARVAFAMPAYGPIYPQVYANHLALAAYTSRYLTLNKIGKVPIIGASDRMYLHSACNTTVRELLDSDCTHIFWTESDMLMPFYAVVKLMEHGKDICSGVYFLRNGAGQPCLYMKGGASVFTGIASAIPISIFPEDSFFKVHCPGMGCVLMKRKVFETIPPPWFDLKEGYRKEDSKMYGYGQDIFFYSKVVDAGFEVWVDSSIHCAQVQDSVISLSDYRKKVMAPDFRVTGGIITEAGPGAVKDGEVPE